MIFLGFISSYPTERASKARLTKHQIKDFNLVVRVDDSNRKFSIKKLVKIPYVKNYLILKILQTIRFFLLFFLEPDVQGMLWRAGVSPGLSYLAARVN